MILQQFIQEVLYRQQGCSLPGIGAFTLQHIPARYDVTNKTISPPGQAIAFDTEGKDDGSCLEWIAQQEQLVPAVARLKMDKYIEELKGSLQTGHPVPIPGIGHLQADATGHISFTPEPLPLEQETLYLPPVLRPDATPKVTIGTTEVVGQQVVEHLTPVPEEPESISRFRWWWVAIPVAAALAATIVWWFISRQPEAAASAPVEEKTAAAGTHVDTMAMHRDMTPADTMQHVNAPSADTIQYYVVIETYHDRERAEKMYHKRKELWKQPVTLLYNAKDSTNIKMAIPCRSLPGDTAVNKEAVRKEYGGNVFLEF